MTVWGIIKEPNVWKKTIGTEFPGAKKQVLYHSMFMTPEDLGNYIYGYHGTAYGFSEWILLFGSEFAARFPSSKSARENEDYDQIWIERGISDYTNGRRYK